MKWIVIIIVPVLVYVGLGWIASDIYFSFIDTSDITIRDYENARFWIYNIIACIYLLITGPSRCDPDVEDWIDGFRFLPIGLAYLMTSIIPVSLGATLLNFLICVIEMMIYTFLAFDD